MVKIVDILRLENINNVLEYSFLAIATYIILFTDYNFILALPLFPLFFIIKYIHRYDKRKRLEIPDYFYTLGLIAIYLNIIGEFFFGFYYNILYYDKFLHLIVPMYLVIVINFFLRKRTRFKMLFTILIVLGLCALWEMLEFAIDTASNIAVMQGVFIGMKELTGGLSDTMKDMFFALIGSTIGLSILPFTKREDKKVK